MARKPIKWGYVLVGKYRPPEKIQTRIMSLCGVDISQVDHLWIDHLPDRATRPRSALLNREYLVSAVGQSDMIMVMNLLCLGNSPKDIEWFIRSVLEKGCSITLIDTTDLISSDTKLDIYTKEFARIRNNAQASASMAKAKNNKNKKKQ